EPGPQPPNDPDHVHRAGHRGPVEPGGSMGCWGSRDDPMPTAPHEIWRRLPAALQHQISDEITTIFQEVIRGLLPPAQPLRAGDAAASAPTRPGLYPPVEPAAGPDESGKSAPAVCPAATRPGSGLASGADRGD